MIKGGSRTIKIFLSAHEKNISDSRQLLGDYKSIDYEIEMQPV